MMYLIIGEHDGDRSDDELVHTSDDDDVPDYW